MTALRSDAGLRIPPVLPHLTIRIAVGGEVTASLDRSPYEAPHGCRGPDGVRRVIDQIVAEHGPVRVEVVESDGAVFTDIATGARLEEPATGESSLFGLGGDGYLPGEAVAVAVVVIQHTAATDGVVPLHLPPAVLSRGELMLVGRTSGHVTLLGAT